MLNLYQYFPIDKHSSVKECLNQEMQTNIELIAYRNLQLNQIIVKKGFEKEFKQKIGFLNNQNQALKIDQSYLCPISPNNFFYYSVNKEEKLNLELLKSKTPNIFYVSEQSNSRQLIEIKGEYVNEILANGCRLDLKNVKVDVNYCTHTQIGQINCFIHKINEIPTYHLMVFNGFAQDFWQWLQKHSYPHGYRSISQ